MPNFPNLSPSICPREAERFTRESKLFEARPPQIEAAALARCQPRLRAEFPLRPETLSPLWSRQALKDAARQALRSHSAFAGLPPEMDAPGAFVLPVRISPLGDGEVSAGVPRQGVRYAYHLRMPVVTEGRFLRLVVELDEKWAEQPFVGKRQAQLAASFLARAKARFMEADEVVLAEAGAVYVLPLPLSFSGATKANAAELLKCLKKLPRQEQSKNATRNLMETLHKLANAWPASNPWGPDPEPTEETVELRVCSLEYSLGERMLSLYAENGESWSWPAVSGEKKLDDGTVTQALPVGLYEVNPKGFTKGIRDDNYEDSSGNIWFLRLRNLFSCSRGISDWESGSGAFGVHPDGGKPGTSGCIGLTDVDTTSARDLIKQYRPSHLIVR